MGFWTNKEHRTGFDEAEDLAHSPSGGALKMWLLGVALPLAPLTYGIHCVGTGTARFFGRRGTFLDLQGDGALALAIAYIAIAVFIHAHWFWGLRENTDTVSQLLKLFATLAFLGGFGFAVYTILR